MNISDVQTVLNELRKEKDLKKFQKNRIGEKFCAKNKITPGQLNFLLSVVAVERMEKSKI
jgi:hypothetical protein